MAEFSELPGAPKPCKQFPGCQAGEVAKEQMTQHKQVTYKLDCITDNQEKINGSIVGIGLKLTNIEFLTKELTELKIANGHEHDILFEDIRKLRGEMARDSDLKTLQEDFKKYQAEKMDWKTKLIIALVGAVVSIGMFNLGHFLK